MKKDKISLIVLFCGLLFCGSVIPCFLPQKKVSQMENRTLQTKPAFHVTSFISGTYQKKYETYLNDQFLLRDRFVDLASAVTLAMGRRSFNGIYVAKEGYLLEEYPASEFDRGQCRENETILTDFLNAMAERYGAEHAHLMLVPSKTEGMKKQLKAAAVVTSFASDRDRMKQALSSEEMYVDVVPVLTQKTEKQRYYRTDHHWTSYGAFLAYQQYAEQVLQKEAVESDYKKTNVYHDFYGTSYKKAHVKKQADTIQTWSYQHPSSVTVCFDQKKKTYDSLYFPDKAKTSGSRYDLFLGGNTFLVDIKTTAKTGRTLLLLKDSFANAFVPFLTEDYDRILMVDVRYGSQKLETILEKNEDITDVLVLYNTEKLMQNRKLSRLKLSPDKKEKKDSIKEFDLDDL